MDAVERIPEPFGKSTFHAKGDTTSVGFECERIYVKDKKDTEVKRRCLGNCPVLMSFLFI